MKYTIWWERAEPGRICLYTDAPHYPNAIKHIFYDTISDKEVIKEAEQIIEYYQTGKMTIKNILQSNPKMTNTANLDSYYYTWRAKSELIGFVPALPAGTENSQYGYSVKLNDSDNSVAPAFYYYGLNCQPNEPIFFFDEECYNDKDQKEEYRNYCTEHCHILFFLGCDDGHVGLRFKTKKAALNYVENLVIFEDVFKEEKLLYHN